jgi:hypothetical protein
MHLEERAIIAPSAQLMLVALLVTLARGEARDEATSASGIARGDALLKRLAQLSLAEIQHLAEKGALKLVVSYEGDQLAWSLQTAAHKRAEQALLEYFMRHGAPRALLRELFTLSRARIDAVRQRLRLAPTQGRPKLPPAREREAIVAAWADLASTVADRRARYHALHGAFPRHSIAALDAVLREVSPERPNAHFPDENRQTAMPVSAPDERRKRASARPGRPVVHRRAPR